MSISHDVPSHLNGEFEVALDAARQGETNELGILLDVYRGYLMAIASREMSRGMGAKVAPSDLVQETLMQASRSFANFHGSSDSELRAWLKKILSRKVIDTHRYYHNFAVRDISREVPLMENARREDQLRHRNSSDVFSNEFTDKIGILTELLGRLDHEQRTAIQLRTFEKLTFDEVGKRLGRTTEAARKIWSRAIQQMTKEFRCHESGSGSVD